MKMSLNVNPLLLFSKSSTMYPPKLRYIFILKLTNYTDSGTIQNIKPVHLKSSHDMSWLHYSESQITGPKFHEVI